MSDSGINMEDLDLSIDEKNMMEEWRKQPALVLSYGLLSADAEQGYDEAKSYLGVVAASIELGIRSDSNAYGLAKVTESAIMATVVTQQEYIEATEDLNKARNAARVFKTACDALAHRKSTLQGMTELFNRQWFADSTSPGTRIRRESVTTEHDDGPGVADLPLVSKAVTRGAKRRKPKV